MIFYPFDQLTFGVRTKANYISKMKTWKQNFYRVENAYLSTTRWKENVIPWRCLNARCRVVDKKKKTSNNVYLYPLYPPKNRSISKRTYLYYNNYMRSGYYCSAVLFNYPASHFKGMPLNTIYYYYYYWRLKLKKRKKIRLYNSWEKFCQ